MPRTYFSDSARITGTRAMPSPQPKDVRRKITVNADGHTTSKSVSSSLWPARLWADSPTKLGERYILNDETTSSVFGMHANKVPTRRLPPWMLVYNQMISLQLKYYSTTQKKLKLATTHK